MKKKILESKTEKILKRLKSEPIKVDWEKRKKEREEHNKQAKIEKEKWLEETKPICPLCKNEKITHVCQGTSNGIYGPGYHSTVTFECESCDECGTLFQNMIRKKNPYKGKEYWDDKYFF